MAIAQPLDQADPGTIWHPEEGGRGAAHHCYNLSSIQSFSYFHAAPWLTMLNNPNCPALLNHCCRTNSSSFLFRFSLLLFNPASIITPSSALNGASHLDDTATADSAGRAILALFRNPEVHSFVTRAPGKSTKITLSFLTVVLQSHDVTEIAEVEKRYAHPFSLPP